MSVCIHTYIYIYILCMYIMSVHTHTHIYIYIYIIFYIIHIAHIYTWWHTYIHNVVHQFRVCITAVFVILHTYYCIPIVINWSMSRILATKNWCASTMKSSLWEQLTAQMLSHPSQYPCLWPSSTTSPMMNMHCPYIYSNKDNARSSHLYVEH